MSVLKELIRKTETGVTDTAAQYKTIIGHNEDKLPKPVTSMTVDEIITASDYWRKTFGTTSGAAGAYQIIKPTMIQLKKDLNLTGMEKFTPELQERMADRLLAKRGLNQYLAGKMTRTEFGNSLAKEWASFPCLAPQARGKVVLRRGQSYYDKVAGNSALVGPGKVEAVLDTMLTREPAHVPPTPPHTPIKPAPKPTWGRWLLMAAVGAVIFVLLWFVLSVVRF